MTREKQLLSEIGLIRTWFTQEPLSYPSVDDPTHKRFVDVVILKFNEIIVIDATGTSGTNNITIARNGNNINSVADNAIIDVDKAAAVLIYTGSTIGWRLG